MPEGGNPERTIKYTDGRLHRERNAKTRPFVCLFALPPPLIQIPSSSFRLLFGPGPTPMFPSPHRPLSGPFFSLSYPVVVLPTGCPVGAAVNFRTHVLKKIRKCLRACPRCTCHAVLRAATALVHRRLLVVISVALLALPLLLSFALLLPSLLLARRL